MKICYFDAFSGIAGDMTVGSLLDAGGDAQALIAALESLNTGASYRVEKTKRKGIGATKFHVDHGEQKAHRHLTPILKMIDNGALLTSRSKQMASDVFRKLGEAEASVHAVPIEKVHFHEVGAVDSIADIVGACYLLDQLGIEEVRCSALNVGSGTVTADHGVMPVPTPATARLLQGIPIYSSGPIFELTTPTGAALVATLATQFGVLPAMKISSTGYGAGTKDFPTQANVLRAVIGDLLVVAESETVIVMEANIDDSTPQLLGHAMDRLFEGGALDVTLQPLLMKKNRQGTLVTVIARLEDRDSLATVLMTETTTIGIRMHSAERRIAPRQIVEVQTQWGKVNVKVTAQGFTPEYEDCRKLALAAGVPLRSVLAEAAFAYQKGI